MAKTLTTVSDFYSECVRRAFRGRLLLAEAIAGLMSLISVPLGLQLKDWLGETYGAVGWVPLWMFGTAFVLLVLYGLLRSPRDLYQEAMVEIAELRLTIEDRERIQKALNQLWKLRKEGVEIRNRRIAKENFDVWLADYNKWRNKVYRQAKKISENLEQWLRILDQLTQSTVVPPIHPQHAHALKIFSEILHRLQVFLERDLRWPKMGT